MAMDQFWVSLDNIDTKIWSLYCESCIIQKILKDESLAVQGSDCGLTHRFLKIKWEESESQVRRVFNFLLSISKYVPY